MHHIDPHDLAHEFNHDADKIRALAASNPQFERLLEDYTAVNDSVVAIERGEAPGGDTQLEALKKQRLHLKDEIAALLRG